MAASPSLTWSRIPRAVAASAALDVAPFGVVWVDHDGHIGYANKHVETLLGWPAAELTGQGISQFARFWSTSEWQNTVWQKLANGTLAGILGSWEVKAGGSRVLSATLARMQIAGQEMVSIYLEPAERAEPMPDTAGDGHPGFIDALPTGICFVDHDLGIVWINPALCAIVGAEPSALAGQSIKTLLAPSNDRESLWHQLPSLGLAHWAFPYRNSHGRSFDLVVSSMPEASASGGARYVVVVEDVTERVQLKRVLEQQVHSFEHLAANTPGMIYKFVISPEGKASFPYASPGSYDIWEIDPASVRDDATPIINLVHPDDLAGFQSSVMKSATELSPWEFEGRMITPSGKLKWWHAASRPELADNGDIVWQGLLMDVTHQKLIEGELKVAKVKAESAARSKADFLANMSHEIRTPMNGVIGMAELLFSTELQPKQRRFVDIIRSSAEVLLTIINDILDISKMEAGKLTLHPAIFNLRRTIDDVATLLAPRAFEKGLELIVRYDPRAPTHVSGDAVRIRQILTNLIGNAIKFTPAGHVLVQIDTHRYEDGRASIKFCVTDTGIGISEDAMKLLFQKFEQADTSTSRKFGGTGLGLAISRQLVEMMGGTVQVSSELDKGSTFSFDLTLPVQDQALDEAPELLDVRGLHVLIVDDHPVNREMLGDVFTAWGVRHADADTGEAALRALRQARAEQQPYNVVLLDYQMPGMDGIFLASAIRAEPEISEVALIMLSSSNFGDDQQRELAKAGVMAQMLKPVRQFELRQALINARPGPVAGSQEDAVMPDTPREPMSPASTEPAEQKSLRVLLAEDNDVNVEIATGMLNTLGFTVDCAANGAEAVAMFRDHPYELVVMDCQMPEMDGFDATRAIRKIETAAPPFIIAMTAHAMAGDRDRCLAAGMDDYLAKPVTFAELRRVTELYVKKIEARCDVGPAVFDLEEALSVTGGNREVLGRAINIWLRKIPVWLADIKSGIQRGDADLIRNTAHTIRGAAANLGARAVSQCAQRVEAEVTVESVSGSTPLYEKLVADIERLREAISGTGWLSASIER